MNDRVEMINGMEADEWRRRYNDDGTPKKNAPKSTEPQKTAGKEASELTDPASANKGKGKGKPTKAEKEAAEKEAEKHTPAPGNAGLPNGANVKKPENTSTPGITTDTNL